MFQKWYKAAKKVTGQFKALGALLSSQVELVISGFKFDSCGVLALHWD